MASRLSTPARERVLAAAGQLFSERGYKAVTLRDIAEALGIRQASLYHHFPGGKEELFVEVTERGLERHRAALEQALVDASPDLESQLRVVAGWLLSQPAIGLARLVRSDLPAISEIHARRLSQAAYQALLAPLGGAFSDAREQGSYDIPDSILLTGAFLSLIEGVQTVSQFITPPATEAAGDMIGVLLNGLRHR